MTVSSALTLIEANLSARIAAAEANPGQLSVLDLNLLAAYYYSKAAGSGVPLGSVTVGGIGSSVDPAAVVNGGNGELIAQAKRTNIELAAIKNATGGGIPITYDVVGGATARQGIWSVSANTVRQLGTTIDTPIGVAAGNATNLALLTSSSSSNAQGSGTVSTTTLRTVSATDDPLITLLGAQGDAAQTSSTTAASLFGYIKGAIANWAALLDRLPASLGTKATVASLSVNIANDDVKIGRNATGYNPDPGGLNILGWLSTIGNWGRKNTQNDGALAAAEQNQAIAGNNILLEVAGVGWIDLRNVNGGDIRSASFRIVGSAGITAGQIIFEGTVDPASPSPVALSYHIGENALSTGTINIAADSDQIINVSCPLRYIRCRISTAFVGGTVSAANAVYRQWSPYGYVLSSAGSSGGGSSSNAQGAGATSATTLRTVTATDDPLIALLGAQGDTPQTSASTAASLFGYVKGGLDRWATFLGRIPASLGAKTAATSFSITLATDDVQLGTNSTDAAQLTGGAGLLGWVSGISKKITDLITATNNAGKVTAASIDSTATSTTGANFALLTAGACTEITLNNAELNAVDIRYQRGGTGASMPIPAGSVALIEGITNSNAIGIKRADDSNTAVTVTFERRTR
jgi:hypothetical protein